MKNVFLAFVLSFICLNALAQSADGKEEYDKVIKGWDDYSMSTEKGYKLLTKACEKGYNPACKRLLPTTSPDANKQYAMRLCAERGDLECMYQFVVYSFGNSNQEAKQQSEGFLQKSVEAKYQPSMLYLAQKYEKEGNMEKAIPMYQSLAELGNNDAKYKLAMQKNDTRQAFEIAKKSGDKGAHNLYKTIILSDDAKYVLEAAKVYSENKEDDSASFLYARACELGSGEGCYRRGLDYLSDYRSHENGLRIFDKAIAYGYKVPEKEYLKMKNPPSAEEVAQMNARLQAQYERDALYAKNHPNGDEVQYKTNTPITKTKSSLTQADMDAIIKANFPSSSSEDERHRLEMEKQARDTQKITNGTWNGH